LVAGKDGTVNSPKVIRRDSPDLDQAAVDAVMKLEAFSPGLMDGKPVSVYYTLPVSFKLTADDKKK
ncbi:MAG: energy transducer TonB, partial [Duncaniella sp.]|nr:energy transducer TonB [Duncaniella sp.]